MRQRKFAAARDVLSPALTDAPPKFSALLPLGYCLLGDAEVALHDRADDVWVSLFHKVLDLTELVKENRGLLVQPLIMAAGTDITHWFDPITKDVRTHIDPETDELDCIDTKEEEITGYTSNDVRKWDGVCAFNGKLYCAPSCASGVLVIDVQTETITLANMRLDEVAAALEAQALSAEQQLQRTSAFWLDKLNGAKAEAAEAYQHATTPPALEAANKIS